LRKIAHRGNVSGPSHKENQTSYIEDAIGLGYDVEVDLWRVSGFLWLGHDGPQYLIKDDFLIEHGASLWIHCKNLDALEYMGTNLKQLNYFWHQEDDFTLTSQGYIWTYPGKEVTPMSVIVDLEGNTEYNCYAICSDYFSKEA
jgi:hypothetical protein